MWAFLWYLLFLSNALNKKIEHYTGMIAFVQSWVTLTLPALLYFLGVWNTQIVYQIWIFVVILAIVYFVVSFFRLKILYKNDNSGQTIQVINALEVK